MKHTYVRKFHAGKLQTKKHSKTVLVISVNTTLYFLTLGTNQSRRPGGSSPKQRCKLPQIEIWDGRNRLSFYQSVFCSVLFCKMNVNFQNVNPACWRLYCDGSSINSCENNVRNISKFHCANITIPSFLAVHRLYINFSQRCSYQDKVVLSTRSGTHQNFDDVLYNENAVK